MTGIVLPEFYKKNRGIIIDIASVSARYHGCFWSIYSASKTGMAKLGEALRSECKLMKKDGIIIQTVTPGIVLTDMAPNNAKKSLKIPEADEFCKNAVNTIGWFDLTYRVYLEKIYFCILKRNEFVCDFRAFGQKSIMVCVHSEWLVVP